jgi:hypothetical protein
MLFTIEHIKLTNFNLIYSKFFYLNYIIRSQDFIYIFKNIFLFKGTSFLYIHMIKYCEKTQECHGDCWHYGCFGGREGCEQKNGGWGGWPEQIKPGEKCLHPEDRDICKPVLVSSLMGVCDALAGQTVMGGPGDNTQLVEILTGVKVSREQ